MFILRNTIIAVITFAIFSFSSSYAAIIMRLSHASAESDSQHKAALFFAERLNELSDHNIIVKVYPNSVLGNDSTSITAARAGTIDFVLSGNPYFTGLMPDLNVLDLPYLFSTTTQVYKILDGHIGKSLLDMFDKHQLKGLAFWEVGFRSVANNKREIATAKDFNGLKVRTTPNPAHIKAFQLLGANPQPMAYSEVFPALESGAIDGHDNAPVIMLASKMYEVQKYLSITNHAYTAMPFAMSKRKYDQLDIQQQEAIMQAAKETAQYQRAYNLENNKKVIDALKAYGMKVNENPDIADISSKVKNETRQLFIDKQGAGLLNLIESEL